MAGGRPVVDERIGGWNDDTVVFGTQGFNGQKYFPGVY
jgi:hypothetical protein